MTIFGTKMTILRGFDQSVCRKRLFMAKLDSISIVNIQGVLKKSFLRVRTERGVTNYRFWAKNLSF